MNNLPEERLTQELEKCLVQAEEPSRFFRILDDIGALKTTFPELHALKDVPAGPPEFHNEGDAFDHTMLVLDEMSELRPNDELALLMSLAHDYGKAATPDDELPNHPKHGERGAEKARQMATRLGMSNEQCSAMVNASRLHMRFHEIEALRESTIIEMVDTYDMDTLLRLVDLAIADSKGRIPSADVDTGPIYARLFAASAVIDQWTGQRLIEAGYNPEEMGGKAFGDLLRQKRVELLREIERKT